MESVAVDADGSTISYLALFSGLPREGPSTLELILLSYKVKNCKH